METLSHFAVWPPGSIVAMFFWISLLLSTGGILLCVCSTSADTSIVECHRQSFGFVKVDHRLEFLCGSSHQKDLTASIRENTTLFCAEDAYDLNNVLALKFVDCKFDQLPYQLLANFKYLNELNLSGLSLKVIRSDDLPVLRPIDSAKIAGHQSDQIVLDLANNHLERIANATFSKQKRLQELLLGNNRLETISAEILAGLPRLNLLQLKKNRVARIAANTFEQLPQLRTLDVSDNELDAFNASWFSAANKLDTLLLDNNQVAQLTRGHFVGVATLRVLGMTANGVDAIEDGTFEKN